LGQSGKLSDLGPRTLRLYAEEESRAKAGKCWLQMSVRHGNGDSFSESQIRIGSVAVASAGVLIYSSELLVFLAHSRFTGPERLEVLLDCSLPKCFTIDDLFNDSMALQFVPAGP
jgi:hypothetical protein